MSAPSYALRRGINNALCTWCIFGVEREHLPTGKACCTIYATSLPVRYSG